MKMLRSTVLAQVSNCSPEFAFACEYDLACTYALSQPDVARDCLDHAIDSAFEAGRPDLMYAANELLSAIGVA